MPEPRIVEKPEFTVVGCRGAFIHALSPDANNLQVIGELWQKFLAASDSVRHRVGEIMHGVIYGEPEGQRSHRHELQYIACAPVDSIDQLPEGMVAYTVPAATFAVFNHVGPIENIGETVSDAYRTWLPSSPYEHAEIADVELYDDRFCSDRDESVMEYWISVVRKSAGASPPAR